MVSPYAEFTVYHPRPGLRTAAAIKRQKTRRQEGPAFDSIFLLLLLLGGHRQSPRRRRGRRPRPRAARELAGPNAGAAASSRHTAPPGLWGRWTFGSPPQATFHHAVPQLFLPPLQHLSLAPGLLLPAPMTLSSLETLEYFGKVYVVLLGCSVILLLLE